MIINVSLEEQLDATKLLGADVDPIISGMTNQGYSLEQTESGILRFAKDGEQKHPNIDANLFVFCADTVRLVPFAIRMDSLYEEHKETLKPGYDNLQRVEQLVEELDELASQLVAGIGAGSIEASVRDTAIHYGDSSTGNYFSRNLQTARRKDELGAALHSATEHAANGSTLGLQTTALYSASLMAMRHDFDTNLPGELRELVNILNGHMVAQEMPKHMDQLTAGTPFEINVKGVVPYSPSCSHLMRLYHKINKTLMDYFLE